MFQNVNFDYSQFMIIELNFVVTNQLKCKIILIFFLGKNPKENETEQNKKPNPMLAFFPKQTNFMT